MVANSVSTIAQKHMTIFEDEIITILSSIPVDYSHAEAGWMVQAEDDIRQAARELLERAKPHTSDADDAYWWNRALDQYHSNLLAEISTEDPLGRCPECGAIPSDPHDDTCSEIKDSPEKDS